MLALEDGDPGWIWIRGRNIACNRRHCRDGGGGDVAWELAPRSIAEGDAIDVDVVSGLVDDAWEARRDSSMRN